MVQSVKWSHRGGRAQLGLARRGASCIRTSSLRQLAGHTGLVAPLLLLLLLLFPLSPSTLRAQTKEPAVDTLYLRDGSKIDALFERFSKDSIHYRLKGLRPQFKIAKARVEKIRYRDGREELMEQVENEQPPSLEAWKKVIVTRERKDVARMVKLDSYDMKFNATSMQRRGRRSDMEQGATIQLQKLAAQKGASHLLIESMEYFSSYGEPPEIRVVGSCYRLLSQSKGEEKKQDRRE